MLNTADSENFSQSLLDNGRRKKIVSGKAVGNATLKGAAQFGTNKPLIITSPLNKSKQDVFSQTGKINPAQLEAEIMLDESS